MDGCDEAGCEPVVSSGDASEVSQGRQNMRSMAAAAIEREREARSPAPVHVRRNVVRQLREWRTALSRSPLLQRPSGAPSNAELSIMTCAGGRPRRRATRTACAKRPSQPTGYSGCRWSCAGRRPPVVGPATARSKHVHDAADHPTVVDPRHAVPFGRRVRIEMSKLLVRQPEAVRSQSVALQKRF